MKPKQMAKRVYHLLGRFLFEQRRWKLNLQGASVDRGAAIAPLLAEGNKRNLRVGRHSFVGRAILHLHQPITIGQRVVVNDGVTILTASHDVDSTTFEATSAPVMIEDYAWIATGACIMPGVTIGRGAVVGAFAVVTRSVDPFAVVAGNPARVVKHRSADLRYNPVALVAQFEPWM